MNFLSGVFFIHLFQFHFVDLPLLSLPALTQLAQQPQREFLLGQFSSGHSHSLRTASSKITLPAATWYSKQALPWANSFIECNSLSVPQLRIVPRKPSSTFLIQTFLHFSVLSLGEFSVVDLHFQKDSKLWKPKICFWNTMFESSVAHSSRDHPAYAQKPPAIGNL